LDKNGGTLTKVDKKRRYTDKFVFFTIGVKMVTIITLIVLISLGSITGLVLKMEREDLQKTAEDNNLGINQRGALEAEDTMAKIRSDALILIHTIRSIKKQPDLTRDNAAYFFQQNPLIAAFFFTSSREAELSGEEFLVNEQFFLSRSIERSLADAFVEKNRTAIRRSAAGETILMNAAPHFGFHLLAMLFPGETGGIMVLFAPEGLNTSFGSGLNQSWMINNSGDILIHADYELIRNAANVSENKDIRKIMESSDSSKQFRIDTDFGVTRKSTKNNWFFDLFDNAKIFLLNKILNKNEKPETVRQFLAYTKLNTGGCIVLTSIEHNKVFEGINATTIRNIYLTIAVLSFSIMLIWFFSKSISSPLKALAAAARKIEGGTFEVELQPKSLDEIGILTASFRRMSFALNIFGRFTNKEIAVKAMRGQIKPGGLPKHGVIFFSDIRDFTEKSEAFTKTFGDDASNKIVNWLNNYFSKMVECVEKTNGIIDKFIGDAVMAHWGTAYTSGKLVTDALNCIMAALMMRKSLYEMNKERKKDDPANPLIHIGCGINTGIVTAGQIGSERRMEYTVIGDPVNLASRIEALNKPLGTDILISEDTYNLVKEFIIVEEMPSVTVKGKEKPVRIFALINLVKVEKGPKTLADVRSLLGIETPDIASVDVNAHEKKYKIGRGDQEK
jgi:adenylate cyclase